MGRAMRFGKVCTGAVIIAAVAGLMGCVQEPPSSEGPSAEPTNSTSSPTLQSPAPPSEPGVPDIEPTTGPTDGAAPDPGPDAADVQILDARFDSGTSGVSVAGMVVNVVSNTGVCTATAKQDDVSVSAAATSVADASVTYCASLVVQLPPGSTGEWTITLAFDEGATHGSTTSSLVVA
jgi:hypothetical protein